MLYTAHSRVFPRWSLEKLNTRKSQTVFSLVRHKPTVYGRATLGAKPLRRVPFQRHCGGSIVGHRDGDGWPVTCAPRAAAGNGGAAGCSSNVWITNLGPNGAFHTSPPASLPRLAGQAKVTAFGRGLFLPRPRLDRGCSASREAKGLLIPGPQPMGRCHRRGVALSDEPHTLQV